VPNAFLGAPLGEAIFQVLLAAFTGGTLFYLLRRATGSIVVAMVAHGLWDFTLFTAADDYGGGAVRVVVAALLAIAFFATREYAFGEPEQAPAAG
jgi:membrane protease YdiL (CAAX protease family)